MLCLHGNCPNIRTLRIILVLLIILVCSLSIGLKSSLRRHFNTFMENGKDLPIKGRIKQVPDLCLRLCHSVQQKSMENRSAQVVSGDRDKCACDMPNKETLVKKEPKCPLVTPRLSDRPLPITGLISFPGAGNTWTRHLLQQVSGLFT